MVTIDFSCKLIRSLEAHLLKLGQYQLPAPGYDLVMLLPIAPNDWSGYRTLLVSAAAFSDDGRWDNTRGLLGALRESLTDDEYISIYNVDVIEPTAEVVQQAHRYLSRQEADGEYDAPISLIGGVTNQSITLIKSTVLPKLVPGQQRVVGLLDGETFQGALVKAAEHENRARLLFHTSEGERWVDFADVKELRLSDRAVRFTTAE